MARFDPGRAPVVVVMAGTTGSGKTTLAMLLERHLQTYRRIESDVVRKQLAGLPPGARACIADVHGGIYGPAASRAAYAEMLERAARCLDGGRGVILDGTFRRRSWREDAVGVARRAGAGAVIVECHVARAIQLDRLEARFRSLDGFSDGRAEVLALHEQEWEPVALSEADTVFRVDACGSLDALAERAGAIADRIARLAPRLVARPTA
jgi:predicted kinase